MPVGSEADRAAVRESARSQEPDRYLSALLAPHAAREDLITLAAFVGEAARIPAIVSEPMIGEIRLQWWRDAIEAPQSDSLTGNPVADAVTGLIRRRGLPMDLFTHVLDARLTDLYADPVPDEATFVAYLEATQRTGFDLAARILGVANSTASEKVLMAAGEVYGLARVLLALPMHQARSRNPFPVGPAGSRAITDDTVAGYVAQARARLEEVQTLLNAVEPASDRGKLKAAILPVALVGPYLRLFQWDANAPGLAPPDLSPFARAWRLWRAHRTGRIAV